MGQPMTLLKVLIDERNHTYDTFSRDFDKTADSVVGQGPRNPTISEPHYRRLTGGQLKGRPRPSTCQVLEAMFAVPVDQLLAPPPPSTDPDVPKFDLEAEIAMTARDAQEDAGATAASSISDLTVDQLRDDVHALARNYNTMPTHEVWRQARELRERAEIDRDRTAIPAQQQVLLILAGQAAALLSAAAFDFGQLDGAKRLARTAALYGESARYDPLRAFAAGSLAYTAYFTGEPSQAAALARQALTYGGLGDVAVRRLQAIEARSHGHLGDELSARRAISLSEEQGCGTTDDLHDDVGGEFGFTVERLAMSNSSTALLIGDGAQAEASARRALDLLTAKPAGERSAPVLGGAAADLAMARLLTNDLEGASEALEVMWGIPSAHRVTGLVARAARLRRSLAQPRLHGTPLAAELGERIEEFMRTSAHRQLGPAQGALELEA